MKKSKMKKKVCGDETRYAFREVIYNHPELLCFDRFKDKTFDIAYKNDSDSPTESVAKFNIIGYSFSMGTRSTLELLQVFPSTEKRDVFMVNYIISNLNKEDDEIEEFLIFGLEHLKTYLDGYFFNSENSIKGLFKQGWKDERTNPFYEFFGLKRQE